MEGKPLYARMAEMVASGARGWTPLAATTNGRRGGRRDSPEEQKIIRGLLPVSYFLVPGYGAQGATAKDIANAFNDDGLGAIVKLSRGIMCAWKRPAETARDYKGSPPVREAIRMRG